MADNTASIVVDGDARAVPALVNAVAFCQDRAIKRVVVAIDIETTGGNLQRDSCFAIGVAVCARASDGVLPITIERYKLLMEIPKFDGESWASVWRRHGFEQRCWNEFWGKHENTLMLDKLQSEAVAGRGTTACADCEHEMAFMLHTLLESIETRYTQCESPIAISYAFDTEQFDPVWINHMLSDVNAQSLLYYRNGRYGVDTYSLNTYVCATLAARLGKRVDELDWVSEVKPFKKLIESRVSAAVVHDHSPDHDAESIAHKFLLVHDTPTPSSIVPTQYLVCANDAALGLPPTTATDAMA